MNLLRGSESLTTPNLKFTWTSFYEYDVYNFFCWTLLLGLFSIILWWVYMHVFLIWSLYMAECSNFNYELEAKLYWTVSAKYISTSTFMVSQSSSYCYFEKKTSQDASNTRYGAVSFGLHCIRLCKSLSGVKTLHPRNILVLWTCRLVDRLINKNKNAD